jgi:hypothetical protein
MSNKVTHQGKQSGQLVDAAHDAITSGDPIKIVGGIAMGVIAVGAMAIWSITKTNR